jgi:cytochrome c oxidase cbb3-type subunit 3
MRAAGDTGITSMRLRPGLLLALLLAAPAAADDDALGKQVYDTRCSFCHGAAGQGDGPAGTSLQPPPTNFARQAYWDGAGANDAALREAIVKGKTGTAMVPFGTTLTPPELDAVVSYVKSFKPR